MNHYDDTSKALLEAAHRLLSEEGADALTVRRIANEADMSTMNVYSRFGSKHGVVDELYIAGFERLYEKMAAAQGTNAAEELLAIGLAYRDFAQVNSTYYGVMFRSTIHDYTPSERASEVGLRCLTLVIDCIERGQANGEVIADDEHTPVRLAAWFWATCHGMAGLEVIDSGTELVSWEDTYALGVRRTVAAFAPNLVLTA